jgi:succinoglycan biosynthesis transport protein ExoP
MDHPQLLPPPRDAGAATPAGVYAGYPESPGYTRSYADDPGSGGLLEYWRILRRRKGTLILIAFIGLVAGVLLTLPQTPVYQARTALEIQGLNENFLNIKQVTQVSEGNSDAAISDIQTQIKLLQSESLVKRVLVKLKSRTPAASTNASEPRTTDQHAIDQLTTEPRTTDYHAIDQRTTEPHSTEPHTTEPRTTEPRTTEPRPLGSGVPEPLGSGLPTRIAAWRKALNLPGPKPSDDFDFIQAAKSLKVSTAGETRIVEIRYDSTNPRYAADFANTLVQEFIDSNMEARWKMSQHTGLWLSHQLEDMRIKLEQSEDALQSYARRTGLMFTSGGSTPERTNISEDKLRQLQQELSRAQGDRITRQARWEMTKTSPAEALPDVLNDSSLRALQDKVTELRRQRAELITTYTEKHSKVQRVEAQIEPLEAALQKERSAIVDRLRNDYEGALRREKLLDADYASQSRLVTDQAGKSIQYDILKREVDSNRQLYEAMLQHVKESSIASAMRASNVRIVDLAEPPRLPYKPSLPINSALGLLSGLFLGIAFVVMRERADCTLQNPGDLQSWLNVPELGVIPSAAKEGRFRLYLSNKRRSLGEPQTVSLTQVLANAAAPHGDAPSVSVSTFKGDGNGATDSVELISWQRKPGPVAESFRALLTSILFSGENGTRPRVLVLSSASPMEGKSTVTSNLGIAFAAINRKVLIIDADLRKPRMHDVFGVTNESGLTTLLESGQPEVLDSVLRPTSIPGLFVLPSGLANQNTTNLLYGARLPELLAKLKKEFDMVIIDTPPMLQMPDARVLGRLADAVILVTRAGHTTRDAAMAANQHFAKDRTRVLGTILNDWDPKTTLPGYYGKRYNPYASNTDPSHT